eukprot:4937894-Prymnesium_polylepis.1
MYELENCKHISKLRDAVGSTAQVLTDAWLWKLWERHLGHEVPDSFQSPVSSLLPAYFVRQGPEDSRSGNLDIRKVSCGIWKIESGNRSSIRQLESAIIRAG